MHKPDQRLRVSYVQPERFHAVHVKVTNLSGSAVQVRVPAGLYLDNSSPSEQPLVTVREEIQVVAAGATVKVRVATACADAKLGVPSRSARFRLGTSPKKGVATFLRVQATVEQIVVGTMVTLGKDSAAVSTEERASVARQLLIWKWYGAPDGAMANRLVEGYASFGGDRSKAIAFVSATSEGFGELMVKIDNGDTEGLKQAAKELASRATALARDIRDNPDKYKEKAKAGGRSLKERLGK